MQPQEKARDSTLRREVASCMAEGKERAKFKAQATSLEDQHCHDILNIEEHVALCFSNIT